MFVESSVSNCINNITKKNTSLRIILTTYIGDSTTQVDYDEYIRDLSPQAF